MWSQSRQYLTMIPQLLRSGCIFWLKVFGWYLIPYARAFDRLACCIAAKWPQARPWTWHVSAAMLSITISVQCALVCHVLVQCCLSLVILRGPLSPCVCEASEYVVGLRQPSSLELFLGSLIDLARASIVAVAAGSKLFSDLAVTVLVYPRSTLLLLTSMLGILSINS